MDKKELDLLEAIQKIINPIQNDINGMKDDMQEVKNDMKDVKVRLTNVEDRLINVEEETRRTSLIVENRIEPRLQASHEGYMPLVEKVRHVPEEIENLKYRVSMLEFVQKQIVEKVRDKP